MLTQSYTEALERSLGAIVARANGELALLRERADAMVAAANARVAEAEANRLLIEARITERLASLRDGRDGKDADPEAITVMVAEVVGRIPPPKDGRDGVDGVSGRDGIDGQPGRDGTNGIDGKAGEPGEAGPKGERGETGPAGIIGERGESGLIGPQGLQGEAGAAGERGEPGESGLVGERGLPGEKGDAGPQGLTGEPGERGEVGPAGDRGAQGERGALGQLPSVVEWAEGVHYESDTVSHLGSTYQALRDTGREPPHDDWRCIAAAGRDGVDGRSPRVRSTWSEQESYQYLDIVALGGASFVARRDDPGPCPGEGWQLMSAQGKRGNVGERGALGKPGERGNPGQPAVAAEINDDGLLTITNGDGSIVTCDLYPVLAKVR